MNFCLNIFSIYAECKHPSTSPGVTVSLSEVEDCFLNFQILKYIQ